jgi:hypothetical protein
MEEGRPSHLVDDLCINVDSQLCIRGSLQGRSGRNIMSAEKQGLGDHDNSAGMARGICAGGHAVGICG